MKPVALAHNRLQEALPVIDQCIYITKVEPLLPPDGEKTHHYACTHRVSKNLRRISGDEPCTKKDFYTCPFNAHGE